MDGIGGVQSEWNTVQILLTTDTSKTLGMIRITNCFQNSIGDFLFADDAVFERILQLENLREYMSITECYIAVTVFPNF